MQANLRKADGMKVEKTIIALCGKGGTGKSVLSALIAGSIIRQDKKRVLLIDADPVMGLTRALGLEPGITVAGIRKRIIEQSRTKQGKEQIASSLDYWILEALEEKKGYSLLAMGASDEPGCFCPLNSLIRHAIDELAQNFDYIIIDGEAGIEQINREVMQGTNILFILTDSSLRGLKTAVMIREKVDQGRARPEKICLILNRMEEQKDLSEMAFNQTGLKPVAVLPDDPWIRRFDQEGKSLLDLPEQSQALLKVREMIEHIL
jgi:CO dehydrogenase maturation factor